MNVTFTGHKPVLKRAAIPALVKRGGRDRDKTHSGHDRIRDGVQREVYPREKRSIKIYSRICAYIFLGGAYEFVCDWYVENRKRRGSSDHQVVNAIDSMAVHTIQRPFVKMTLRLSIAVTPWSLFLEISFSFPLLSLFFISFVFRFFNPDVVVPFDVSGPLRFDRDCVPPVASRYYPSGRLGDQAAKRQLSPRVFDIGAQSRSIRLPGVCRRAGLPSAGNYHHGIACVSGIREWARWNHSALERRWSAFSRLY